MAAKRKAYRIFPVLILCFVCGCAEKKNEVYYESSENAEENLTEDTASEEAPETAFYFRETGALYPEEEAEEDLQEEESTLNIEQEISEDITETEEDLSEDVSDGKTYPCIEGASIWAISDLEISGGGIFAAGERSEVISFDEKEYLFEIEGGYVDASMCMIDLVDYLGDLLSYDIASAYSAAFTVSGYDIPGITGEVLPGYEDRIEEDGTFIVPLLFPAAEMLYEAVLSAAEYGYAIEIIDAYRPYETTRYLYDTVESLLYEECGDGTYYSLMTNNGTYQLSAFLAKSRSTHNYGVAVDIRLLDETGKEISMQTKCHDLSWNSVVSNNNENADVLADIMTGAGFNTLSSEWWHFQDNESYNRLKTIGIDVTSLSLQFK